MKTFIVTIHLPAVGHPNQEGLIGVVTPTGKVDFRRINASAVANITEPCIYAEDLLDRMYPAAVKGKMHGATLEHRTYCDTSATVVVVRVDIDS